MTVVNAPWARSAPLQGTRFKISAAGRHLVWQLKALPAA
jgi:hypothetical protein